MNSWFIFTLLTIVFWSGSDLFAKWGTDLKDKNSQWKMSIVVGLVMGIHAIYTITLGGVEFQWSAIITYLPISALYISSMIVGYVGLRYIELSISSPICNSSGALCSILCFFILKQTMNAVQLVAIVLITIGIVGLGYTQRSNDSEIAEADRKYTKSPLAIGLPLGYCLLDALGTFGDSYVLDVLLDEEVANSAYELTWLAVAIFSIFYLNVVKHEKWTPMNLVKDKYDRTKVLGALCETAGQFTYVFALSGNAIVAAPAICSYSLLSNIWARLFLKEKLTTLQYIIICVVMAGVITLGVFDA